MPLIVSSLVQITVKQGIDMLANLDGEKVIRFGCGTSIRGLLFYFMPNSKHSAVAVVDISSIFRLI